jgi:acetyl esterase/lipase
MLHTTAKLVAGLALLVAASAARPGFADDVKPTHAEITYATVDGVDLKLDLYVPAAATKPRLIVWVHGGAWRSGSKSDVPVRGLFDSGFAIASVDYRLSPVAKFPAQVHDIKAAIRFLRAKEKEYGYDAAQLAIAGSSAGGHLAALVGVTNDHAELEGKVGDHLDQSSGVQAIVSFYGMSNLTTILDQSTPHGLKVRVPALELLLGGQPAEQPELARLASPVFHIDTRDPPLLLLHGDQDPQSPINQSHELAGRYEAAGRPCRLVVVHGGKHGGAEFYDTKRLAAVREFLGAAGQ